VIEALRSELRRASILKERSIIIRSLTPQQATGNVLATGFKIMTDKPREPRKLHHIAKDIGRLIWCAVGVATGIGLALWFVSGPSSPFLLASLGGSSVFLFGPTRAAATQPRALFGGHLGSALIGIFCFHSFGDALWVYMLATKTVHPTSRSESPYNDSRACWFLQPLATGWSWYHHPRLGRCGLEPSLARHESLPYKLVCKVTPFYSLGWLE
jgi:hypothetical protein